MPLEALNRIEPIRKIAFIGNGFNGKENDNEVQGTGKSAGLWRPYL